MALLISQEFFVPLWQQFTEDLTKRFPGLTHCETNIRDKARELLRREPRYNRDGSIMRDAKGNVIEIKIPATEKKMLFFMKWILKDFGPFEKELISDEINVDFFQHSENTLVRHLQLRTIWDRKTTTQSDREWIWRKLNALYLICLSLERLPEKLLIHFHNLMEQSRSGLINTFTGGGDGKGSQDTKKETTATTTTPTTTPTTDLKDSKDSKDSKETKDGKGVSPPTSLALMNGDRINVKNLLQHAKTIMNEVGEDQFVVLMKYIFFLVRNPHSPIPELVPHRFEAPTRRLLKLLQTEKGIKQVGKWLKPLKKAAKKNGLGDFPLPEEKEFKSEDGKVDETKAAKTFQNWLANLVDTKEDLLQSVIDDKDRLMDKFKEAGKTSWAKFLGGTGGGGGGGDDGGDDDDSDDSDIDEDLASDEFESISFEGELMDLFLVNDEDKSRTK